VCIFLLLSFTLPANCLAAASLPLAQKAMGRKPDDPDELLARAKANGYRRGEHKEQDAVPNRHAYIDKTIYDQDGALRRYVVWKLDEMRCYTERSNPSRPKDGQGTLPKQRS